MQNVAMYHWERLEVYHLANQFARLLGRLLMSLPSRFHIHVHNLIGQAVVMTNAIPGAHRDTEPGAPPIPVEERRAWLMIGLCASGTARDLLDELGRSARHARTDVAAGLKLLEQIELSFQEGLDSLDDPPIHLGPIHRA